MQLQKVFKSFGSVFAGFAVVFILSVAVDVVLEKIGFFPPNTTTDPTAFTDWMCAVALAYRSVITVLGGYVTARLAPSEPMKHVVALGIIGAIGGTVGTIVAWEYGHQWYPIALAVTALPLTWWGGKLYRR